MKQSDVLRLLLISHGFTKKLEIKTYRAHYGNIGFSVNASDNYGHDFHLCNCEGLLFNIHEILSYMKEENISPIIGQYTGVDFSITSLLTDDGLKKYNKYNPTNN